MTRDTGLQLCRHLLRMLPSGDVGIRFLYLPIRTDQVTNPFRGTVALILTSTVAKADFSFCVTQERIRESLLLGEFAIRLDVIRAHADNLNVLCFEVLDSVPESYALSRSATRAGSGVKPHQHPLAGEIRQRDRPARVILHLEIGCVVPHIQHRPPPSVSHPTRSLIERRA